MTQEEIQECMEADKELLHTPLTSEDWEAVRRFDFMIDCILGRASKQRAKTRWDSSRAARKREKMRQAVDLYNDGLSRQQIAERMKIARMYAGQLLREAKSA